MRWREVNTEWWLQYACFAIAILVSAGAITFGDAHAVIEESKSYTKQEAISWCETYYADAPETRDDCVTAAHRDF